MRQLPWSLVRHVFLELRRLMPAGRPWLAGVGLLGLFASTFFRPFRFLVFVFNFLFFVFVASTLLVRQLHQERTQMEAQE